MGKLLVHITHGPEAPTRAALGLLVATGVTGCGRGSDPNNLTPEQEQNIQDELKSQEELADQPPI